MDADELRKSMVQEVRQAAAKAEERVVASRLLDRLRDQATVVRDGPGCAHDLKVGRKDARFVP